MSARVLAQAMGAAMLFGISGSFAADEGLEPVVVTAQRREESAQSVGIAISGAKLILYPRVGHLPQFEIPQRSAADVASFLRANPPAPVSSAHATGLSG